MKVTDVLCVQLDILEYIHEHEYVHADIKASNLMLSHTDPNQVSATVYHQSMICQSEN